MKRVWFILGWGLVLAGCAGALAFVLWSLKSAWRLGGGAHLGVHGWVALGLAFVLTGALGGGLMWLAFYSSRKGWDDNVGVGEDDAEP